MDDLSGTISSFLSQPGAMEQMQKMAQQLGLGGLPEPQEKTTEETLSPEMVSRLMSALSEASRPDESTALLEALRPLLRRENQEKIDRAIKALRLMRAAKTVSSAVEL